MPQYLHYSLSNHSLINDAELLSSLGSSDYSGVIISEWVKSKTDNQQKSRLKKIIKNIKKNKLQTGIVLDCFQNDKLYISDDFTPPVAYNGAVYNPTSDYFPVCPNNPIGLQEVLSQIESIFEIFTPDYLYLNHFQFPFDWKEEDLDIQDKSPRFCYCPFCITEFSSVVGEIVTSSDQIEEMMPEWLEWRTDSVENLLIMVKQHLPGNTQLIVGLPPLAMIDLPFSIGLLPHSLIDEGIIISPQLFHKKQKKKLLWIEDVLDQYRIDLNQRKIWPFFNIQSSNELAYINKLTDQYGAVIISDLTI